MRKVSLIIFILAFCAQAGLAQTDYEDDYFSEFTWGINKNTNGGLIGGIIFKLARRQHNNVFTTYGLEFLNVKHPKEQRYLSNTTGTSFVWGKQNFLYSIRARYGKDILLYKKAPQQGVQISTVMAGGPTLGVIAPYYILYSGEYVPYDPEKNQSFNGVQGSGKLFQGLGDSELTLGLNAKVGLAFEFGAFKNNVAGLEVGASIEAFPKEIIIIPSQDNRAIFTALYFNLYWGTRK